MSKMHRAAASTLLALLLAVPQAPSRASAGGARLEGFLIDVDGRAAAGFRVHLIDSLGDDVAQATTSGRGIYAFQQLPAGTYSLGIENIEGRIARVAAPGLRLGTDELARRDIKLMQANAAADTGTTAAPEGFLVYWAGLPPAVRASSVVGVFVILGLTLSKLDDESTATVTDPTTVSSAGKNPQ